MSDLDACLLARFAGRQPPDWLRRWLDDWLDAIIGRGRGRPLVVAVRDAHRVPWQRDLLGRVLARRPDAVVVGTGGVHDRHLAGRGYLGTRRAGRANLEAAADLLLGGRATPADGAAHDVAELSP